MLFLSPAIIQAMDDETRAPVVTLTPNTHPCLTAATSTGGNTSGLVSMTSFLGYMQRRLSDFVAPDSLTLTRRMQIDAEGQQTNSLEDASAIVGGLESVAHDSYSVDSTPNHHRGSLSVHRAGYVFYFTTTLTQRVLCARGCGALLNRHHLTSYTLTAPCFDVQLLETPCRSFRFFSALSAHP